MFLGVISAHSSREALTRAADEYQYPKEIFDIIDCSTLPKTQAYYLNKTSENDKSEESEEDIEK